MLIHNCLDIYEIMWYLFVSEVIIWLAELKDKVQSANGKTADGKAGLISARTKTARNENHSLLLF